MILDTSKAKGCFFGGAETEEPKPGGRRSRSRSPRWRQRAGVVPSSRCPREDGALEKEIDRGKRGQTAMGYVTRFSTAGLKRCIVGRQSTANCCGCATCVVASVRDFWDTVGRR